MTVFFLEMQISPRRRKDAETIIIAKKKYDKRSSLLRHADEVSREQEKGRGWGRPQHIHSRLFLQNSLFKHLGLYEDQFCHLNFLIRRF